MALLALCYKHIMILMIFDIQYLIQGDENGGMGWEGVGLETLEVAIMDGGMGLWSSGYIKAYLWR